MMDQRISLYKKGIRIALLLCPIFILINVSNATIIDNLRVEYTVTPLGIDVKAPRFSWQMTATAGKRNYEQSGYQLEVKDSKGNLVWNTSKVVGSAALGIVYAGTPLKPATRYTWRVTVWDQTGAGTTANSWFETGLMNPGPWKHGGERFWGQQ
jgi:alpha-L-rhamnosidase